MASSTHRFTPAPCQPRLLRSERKATGVYYTPPEIVRLIVDLTLGPLLDGCPPRILDPACGAGEFLLAAHQQLRAKFGKSDARQCLAGVDIDPAAVATTRRRIREIDSHFTARNIRVADTLVLDSFAPASFDAVIGNPPYVNIRQLAKSYPREKIDWLRSHYRTARGNLDLYVLFIERAIELLRPGGRCGLIVPNKWATLDYARPCRELLLNHTTVEQVIDYSDTRVFAGASVYPHVLIFRKQPPAARHLVRFRSSDSAEQTVRQNSLSADSIALTGSFDIESRLTTVPLSQVAKLSCGTAGYAAQKIAHRLFDCNDRPTSVVPAADFVTSGNINRYSIEPGNVRYLNRDYTWPQLPLDISEITAAKRRLYSENKIVLAGMSRRLEAAWDDRGLALGVQVFAASEIQVDPFYLLALLNSKLLSYLFATRYAAKRLGGGYLAINKGQLARLPIRVLSPADRAGRKRQQQLSRLAAEWKAKHDAKIDQLVYELYRLATNEIARVEAHFSMPSTWAA